MIRVHDVLLYIHKLMNLINMYLCTYTCIVPKLTTGRTVWSIKTSTSTVTKILIRLRQQYTNSIITWRLCLTYIS